MLECVGVVSEASQAALKVHVLLCMALHIHCRR